MLTNREFPQVLECIGAIHRCRTLADFPARILAALAALIPSNLSAFNEVNEPRNRLVAVTNRPLPGHTRLVAIWEKHCNQHPLLRYHAGTGDGQAVKISDFLTTREYHRLDLYQEFYRSLDAEDQMTLTIRSDGGIFLTLAFNRPRRDFRETDRLKLNLVRPHILQAYANAEELAGHEEEKADLRSALRETGHGMISLDSHGQPVTATPGALERLHACFPNETTSGELPRAVREWLAGGDLEPFDALCETGRIVVRRAGNSVRPILLLSEETGSSGDFERFGLTCREGEVLRWLSQGKTNPEIAVILGVAAGTAKLHVERILAKLGAANRTEAARIAREVRAR